MNRIALSRIPLFAAALGLAFAASAQTTTPAPAQAEATTPNTTATAPAAVADAEKSADRKKEIADNSCLTQTGSRIAPRADKQGRKCVNAPGRAYSKDDLDRTGATDLADALRRLDPSVR